MNNMQQRVYRPPNVAGWEGGLSWLNTNTVQGRFDLVDPRAVPEVLQLLPRDRGPAPRRRSTTGRRRTETAQALFDRAYAAVNRPWISAATSDRDRRPTPRHAPPRRTAAQRRQRFYALQALMLGGPDGQVM